MIEIGRTSERSWTVGPQHLASALGSGLADVLATPALVAFCEQTARASVDPELDPGASTVGTRIEIEHTAPTPLGGTVTVVSRLIRVDGRRLRFEIHAGDEVEPIGRATHERAIIDRARFDGRVAEKVARVRSGEIPDP